MTQASTAYEKFVQEIYQALLNQQEVQTIDVQHNVLLFGRSGAPYRVDVYWEFKLAGTKYRTCVECRHYQSTVSRDEVNAFWSWLEDIGNTNGIIVTTQGYQSGAITYAKDKRNIRLLVMNPLLQKVQTTFHMQIPSFALLEPVADAEAVRELMVKAERANFIWDLVIGPNTMLLNASGEEAMSLNLLVNREVRNDGQHELSLKGYYLPSEIGLIPLVQIRVMRTSTELRDTMTVNVGDGSRAILDDVLANTSEYVKEDGTLSPVGDGKHARIIPGSGAHAQAQPARHRLFIDSPLGIAGIDALVTPDAYQVESYSIRHDSDDFVIPEVVAFIVVLQNAGVLEWARSNAYDALWGYLAQVATKVKDSPPGRLEVRDPDGSVRASATLPAIDPASFDNVRQQLTVEIDSDGGSRISYVIDLTNKKQ